MRAMTRPKTDGTTGCRRLRRQLVPATEPVAGTPEGDKHEYGSFGSGLPQ